MSLINGESPGHLVPQCALDLTPATAKSSGPGACRYGPQVWSRSFFLSNYPSLHLSSHWSVVFCKASEALITIISQRARPKQTSGAVVSSMNSLNEFSLSVLSPITPETSLQIHAFPHFTPVRLSTSIVHP